MPVNGRGVRAEAEAEAGIAAGVLVYRSVIYTYIKITKRHEDFNLLNF